MTWRGVARYVVAPLKTLPFQVRWLLVGLLTLATAAGSWFAQRDMPSPFALPDALFYVHMAGGRVGEVGQPFASRPLAPLLVRAIVGATHLRVETGFQLLGWVSLLSSLAVVFGLAMQTSAPRWILLGLAAVPFWPELLQDLALPDLPYAALLCGLLLCLFAERYAWAALMLFPLMLARESTMLVGVCLIGAAWPHMRVRGSVLAAAAVAAGALTVRRLSVAALGNVEHLPATVYLGAKLPWNGLRTLGVDPWSNLYPYLCQTPMRQMAVHLGPLQSVGVCRFSTVSPYLASSAVLTIFGLLPMLAAALVFGRGAYRGAAPYVRFCVLYGGISFCLAPMLGTAYGRLFGYSWPLFLVGLPALYQRGGVGRDAGSRGTVAVVVGSFMALQLAIGSVTFFSRPPWALGWSLGFQLAGLGILWTPWRAVLLRSAEAGSGT